MVSSPLNRKSNLHSRSNSLPSRPNPLIPRIDEHFARLQNSSEATSSSSSSMSKNLSALRDVYELVDALLQLPHAAQALAQQCQDDEVLGRSLRLLDACGMAKDALLQAKANTLELQSTLRRRRGDQVEFVHEVKEYLASRKDAKKSINKFLRNLKKCCLTQFENDVEATLSVLREVEGVTLSVLESLLSHISGPKMQPKSLISKLLHNKRIVCEEEAFENNEFAKVDAALCTLIGQETRKADNISIKNAQNELQKLESSIEDLEDGVGGLMRQLIKIRVYVLNTFSH